MTVTGEMYNVSALETNVIFMMFTITYLMYVYSHNLRSVKINGREKG